MLPATKTKLLAIDTEVEIVTYGAKQSTPYIGCTGRVVAFDEAKGLMLVILDNDPVPRWRDLGILCYMHELRVIE